MKYLFIFLFVINTQSSLALDKGFFDLQFLGVGSGSFEDKNDHAKMNTSTMYYVPNSLALNFAISEHLNDKLIWESGLQLQHDFDGFYNVIPRLGLGPKISIFTFSAGLSYLVVENSGTELDDFYFNGFAPYLAATVSFKNDKIHLGSISYQAENKNLKGVLNFYYIGFRVNFENI